MIHLHRCGLDCLQQHRDRVVLMLGTLQRMGGKWTLAQNAVRCLKIVAETLFSPRHGGEAACPQAFSFQNSATNVDENFSNAPWFDLFSRDSDVIGLDPYWIGWIWMDFGWIGLVLLHYWMDWIDARESNWIQLPKTDSRYLIKVYHESGGLAPRRRVYFAFAGVSAIHDTKASCFPSRIC